MTMLFCGVILWSFVHLSVSLTPGVRSSLIERMGEGPYKGLFAVLILGSIALMVFGWMAAPQYPVYITPTWGHPAGMALILVGFILMGAANMPTNIKQFLRHPQLTGTILWATGHLLSNGDNLSVILFGGLGIWSALEIILINMREGEWQKPEPVSMAAEIKQLVIGLIVYAVFFGLHPWLFGVSPI